jgi:hypothetical protein
VAIGGQHRLLRALGGRTLSDPAERPLPGLLEPPESVGRSSLTPSSGKSAAVRGRLVPFDNSIMLRSHTPGFGNPTDARTRRGHCARSFDAVPADVGIESWDFAALSHTNGHGEWFV